MENVVDHVVDMTFQHDRILARETAYIESIVRGWDDAMHTSRDLLSAVSSLLNCRQRYFGYVGELFSVRDIDGMSIVDQMDKTLVSRIQKLLESYHEHHELSIRDDVMEMVNTQILTSTRKLPPYPVAFMIAYVVRDVFDKFETVADRRLGYELEDIEDCIVSGIWDVVSEYSRNRKTPVTRHFSDVAREYSVVNRLRCTCENEQFEVTSQILCVDKQGAHYDRLQITCSQCAVVKTINFPLPNFKDISAAS